MKKIMFSDRYDLTKKVLCGQKTQTRRNVKWDILDDKKEESIEYVIIRTLLDRKDLFSGYDAAGNLIGQSVSAFHIGEEVAVAQKYSDLSNCKGFYEALEKADPSFPLECIKGEKGCNNKMFVKPEWMPHRIRITGIRMEKMQSISTNDCLAEGVDDDFGEGVSLFWWSIDPNLHEDWRKISHEVSCHILYGEPGNYFWPTAQGAFSALIERINGKGTWERNPWVWVYEFELIR